MELPTLSEPLRLWWLCVALPALFLLLQPPRPRREVVTAHPAQWRLAIAALGRRPVRFRALRWALLSAAAVLAALAAAAPELPPADGKSRLVVLLDGSASAGARNAAGMAGDSALDSALDRAVAAARTTLATVPADIEVQVVQLGDGGFRRWSGSSARTLLQPALAAGTLPCSLRELAAAAASDPDAAVWTLTDGHAVATELPAVGAVSVFGSAGDNAAIAVVAVDDRWPQPELTLRVEVVGFGRGPLPTVLRCEGALEAPAAADLVLPPGERVRHVFAVRRAAVGGEVSVTLAVPGDLQPADDRWAALLAPLPRSRIALRADGNPVFARAAAQALAANVGGEVVDAGAGEEVGFLVLEGGTGAVAAGQAPMLTFGTAPAPGAADWPLPVVVDWDRRSPLLQDLDLSELQIDRARRAVLPPGEPLILGSDGAGGTAPLAVLVRGEHTASVHFAFRLQDSTLPLLPAFPQLLQRAFRASLPAAGSVVATTPPVDLGEADLRRVAAGVERPLPPLRGPGRDLAPWCAAAALLLLALRAAVR